MQKTRQISPKMRGNFDWNGKYMVINMNSRWKRQIWKQNSLNPLKISQNSREKLKILRRNSKTQAKNSRFRQIHLVYLPKIGRKKKPGLHPNGFLANYRHSFAAKHHILQVSKIWSICSTRRQNWGWILYSKSNLSNE